MLFVSAVLFLLTGVDSSNLRKNIVEDIYLRFYINDIQNYTEYNLENAENVLQSPNFDFQKTTVIYIIGYQEYLYWENTITVMSAYLKRGDHNPIVLDWTNMNQGDYVLEAAPRTQLVATALSKFLNKFINEGVNPDLIHLVGHSLGGQIAGFTGDKLQKNFNKIIARITLLDPAYPGFYYMSAAKTDAKFVDVIHTDASIYGSPVSIGTSDFWPNGGKRHQPGCPSTFLPFAPKILSEADLCSHWRSWKYWAESLEDEKAFPSSRCWRSKKKKIDMHRRHNDIQNYMGYAANPTLSGDYCVATNSEPPFGLGTAGV